ncbi:cation:proton antiporter [Natronosporangium hydrolyticum]|uniref:Cation:proton antiporter n=1 Tax=Natronosporangium hydrolyticum TaxID=2811111 RepID=A0A895YJX9_9ACTN|nr:cation:proton antiporter [Natronosporangium hydrolyticum]QSB16315.1 cation:proton antiporter [Natronosporangium hydrolyticum]
MAHFLLAVAVVVLACQLTGALLVRLRQPRVVGEILGGLLLGPSAFGLLLPAARGWLFTPEVVSGIQMAAELGVVMFMFLLGCELQLGQIRARRRSVALIVAGGMGLPFLAGAGLAWAGHGLIGGAAHAPAAHILFFGLAMSITALPVLARMLGDLRKENTPLGTLTLACAATGDGLTWAVLAVMFGMLGVAGGGAMASILLPLGLLAVTVAVVRPGLRMLVARVERSPSAIRLLLPLLVAGALAYAGLAELAGLHPVIGAFLFGLVVPRGSQTVAEVNHHLRGFAVMILLPLFFAGIGLDTTVGALGADGWAWLFFGAVLLVAVGSKLLGAASGAQLSGLSARESWQVGALMNCRGVTELVVISVGFEYQLINSVGLTTLVLMALITTALTAPLVRAFERWPREPAPVEPPASSQTGGGSKA